MRGEGFAPLARPPASDSPNRSQIAVFAPRRGIGASTVARAVAERFAARAHERVALALLDPRPQRTTPAGVGAAPPLSETTRLLAGSALAAPAGDGLWIVRWSRAARAALLDASAVGELIEQISDRAQRVVYDCEHLVNERTLSALDAAHHVLLLTRLTVPSIRATQRVLRIFLRLGYPDDKLRIVVNGVDGRDAISVSDAAGVLRREIYWQLPEDPATSAAGLALPGSELARACGMLADALVLDNAPPPGT